MVKKKIAKIDEYFYDENNNEIRHTDSTGFFEECEYNSNGELTHQHDSNGNVFDLITADGFKTEKTQKFKGDELIFWEDKKFDNTGKLILYTDSVGKSREFTYDKNGVIDTQLIRSSYGKELLITYDEHGNELAHSNSDVVREYTYDDNGNMLTQKINGDETTFIFGDKGNILSMNNGNGYWEQHKYNDDGKPLSYVDSDGWVENWVYDNIGNIIEHSVDNDNYDCNDPKFGENIKSERMEYDENNNLILLEETTGIFVIREHYNYIDNKLISYDAGSIHRDYEYDDNGNLIKCIEYLTDIPLYPFK